MPPSLVNERVPREETARLRFLYSNGASTLKKNGNFFMLSEGKKREKKGRKGEKEEKKGRKRREKRRKEEKKGRKEEKKRKERKKERRKRKRRREKKEKEMEEDKKEGRQRRKDRKKNCFTGSMLECDIFLYSNLMYSRSPEVKESSLPLLIIDLSQSSDARPIF